MMTIANSARVRKTRSRCGSNRTMSTNYASEFRKLLLISWFSGLAASCIQRTEFYWCAQYAVVVRGKIAAYECVDYVDRFGTCPSKETPTYDHEMNLHLLECCTDFDCPIGFKCCKEADYQYPYSLCKLPVFDDNDHNHQSSKENEDHQTSGDFYEDYDYYNYCDETDVESSSNLVTDPYESGSGHSTVITDEESSGEESGSGSLADLDITTEETGSTDVATANQNKSEVVTESDFGFDEDTTTVHSVSTEGAQIEIASTTEDFDDENTIPNTLENENNENIKAEEQGRDDDYVDPS